MPGSGIPGTLLEISINSCCRRRDIALGLLHKSAMDRQQVITAATVVAVAVLAIGGTYWISTYYTKRQVDVVLARVSAPQSCVQKC